MVFTYPAVFTEKPEGGYHVEFPDLEGIDINEAELDRAIDEARDAMNNWLLVEFEEDRPVIPPVTDKDEMVLEANQTVRNISVHFRFNTGWDE